MEIFVSLQTLKLGVELGENLAEGFDACLKFDKE